MALYFWEEIENGPTGLCPSSLMHFLLSMESIVITLEFKCVSYVP